MDGERRSDNDQAGRTDNERDRRARRRRPARTRPPRRWLWLGAALLLLLPPPGAGAPLVAGGGGGAGTDPAPGRSPGPPPSDDPLERWCGGGGAEEYEDNAVADEDYAVTSVAADAASASSTLSFSSAPAPRQAPDGPGLVLELTHPLFATSHGLLPGLVYTVRVSRPDATLPAGAAVWVWSDAGAVAPPWDGVPCLTGAASRLPRPADNASFTWAAPPGPDPSQPNNVTFRARYWDGEGPAREASQVLPLLDECELRLQPAQAEVSWLEVPAAASWGGCRLRWPGPSVLVTLLRLNAACDAGGGGGGGGGRLRLGARTLCGKLQELPPGARSQHLPPPAAPLLLTGRPRFALRYRLVDACYDQRLDARNGSLALDVPPGLDCTFRLLQPYGQRVRLELDIGGGADDVHQESEPWQTGPPHLRCDSGVLLTLTAPRDTAADDDEGGGSDEASGGGGGGAEAARDQRQGQGQLPLRWGLCAEPGAAPVRVVLTAPANAATLRVLASPAGLQTTVALRLRYAAVADASLESGCGYGWSALSEGRCAAAMAAADADQRLSWPRAQQRCRDLQGHLASVASAALQARLDRLLRATHSEDADVAYWIGATDRTLEGDFHWSDGQPFLYSNWFPQQPNDDALAEQNCVEVRRALAGHRDRSFRWNDRSCAVRNAFVCQRRHETNNNNNNNKQQGSGGPPASTSASCRRSVRLSRESPRATASSPGFPRHYPDNADCLVDVAAPDGYRIVVDFEELVLEDEPTCSYDYLQILEPVGSSNSSVATRRLCGDWSSRLKKLRYVSQGPALQLRFFSDYSHHYSGYKARISMEQAAVECADERLQVFNSSCYLFVSYPQVSWQTARQTCQDRKAELASIGSPEEQSFVTASIRNSPEYSTAAVYWLGGRAVPLAATTATTTTTRGRASWAWAWADGAPFSYSGWLRDEEPVAQSGACLALQWVSSASAQFPSGLHWRPQRCSAVGGYVCKRSNQVVEGGVQLNRTVNGSEGFLTSPNFPGGYGPNLDYWVRLAGPAGSRLVLRFTRLDLEPQQDCLYDFIELRSLLPRAQSGGGGEGVAEGEDAEGERAPDSRVVRCGRHEDSDLHRLNFVSESNEALLHFHSDYSVSGGGFSASWQAVDVSGCPLQTLTAREGQLTSPNYPHFLLAHLDCATTILAPAGRRVWLEFSEFSVGAGEALLEVDLGGGQAAFQPFQAATHLTDGVFLSVGERLQVRLRTADRPSGAGFSAVYRTVGAALERRVLRLASGAVGSLLHLNWPRPPPPHADLSTLLVAPPAHTVLLELHHVALALAPAPAAEPAPASAPGDTAAPSCPDGAGMLEVRDSYADSNGTAWLLCEAVGVPPLAIASYLNTLTVRQRGADRGVTLNATVRVQPDSNYKLKLLRGSEDGSVESCTPNPCLNGGRCLSSGNRHSCQCSSHYTGMFCALTLCELEPCLHGQCRLTDSGYACHCQPGFTGAACDRKQRPCADNPCEGRGECLERGDAFHCRCHAWWEGQRCERRMMHIPFKPLSERMLQEPFWLGLITVTVVLLLIGLVWCAKRHFPEKLEKLLAEEADRSRSVHSRPPSVRDHLAGAGAAAVVVVPSPQPGCPRSLLGRLGIRKPSLLSLTSPHGYNSHPSAATARTFSLDDLLKPPPRRTPSPRKKRNNSTPTKKNAAEKKQILQQLINQQPSRKVSIGELIQLSERKAQEQQLAAAAGAGAREAETAFGSAEGTPDSGAIMDAKLEKKVTFARLLSKVSAEMSSGGSDGEVVSRPAQLSGLTSAAACGGNGASGAAAASLPRSASSPHSTSSTQGSDSVSSAEVSRRRASGPAATGAPPSADAILAMFRTFARAPTPSTASSPQDDDDDASSTTSSVPSSSLTVESPPPAMRNTIEVPVLDALSPHRGASNLLHPPSILLELPAKCLSPITEMPTPVPTPIMSRHGSCAALPAISLTPNEHDDVEQSRQSSGGRTSPAAAAIPAAAAASGTPPPAPAVAVPTLWVQHASPPATPRARSLSTTSAGLPGSPPPQQRRQMLKELDKPASLDLPCPPPIITVTCNLSEPDSDDDDDDDVDGGARRRRPASAAGAGGGGGGPSGLAPAVAAPMCYLSPFSMCSRADRTASESNLSSSGYSSMASPGPSRCGSNNPLCPSETDEPPPPGPGGPAPPSSGQTASRRASPLLLLPPAGSQAPPTTQLRHLHTQHDAAALALSPDADAGGDGTPPAGASGAASALTLGAAAGTCTSIGGGSGAAAGAGGGVAPGEAGCPRARSDSETLSDDIFLESNDEGIGTDHIDEKIEEGELKSAKELEVFIGKELVESGKTLLGLSASRTSLQLPSIVVHGHGQEQSPSPVSSRSDSPLSEKANPGLALGLGLGLGLGRLARGDSDGLFECATAGAHTAEARPRRSGGRRHRHRSGAQPACSTSPSQPQPQSQPLPPPPPSLPPRAKSPLPELLDVPLRERRKQSPKRARTRVSQLPASTSSSSESLDSAREMTLRLSSSEKALCPERHCWSGGSFDEGRRLSIEASGEDTGEDVMSQMLPKTLLRGEDLPKSSKKISRLRTIGHQIRFLRRLEQSLKRRECLVSPSDSLDEEEPPLLHKSSSYGQLQASGHGHHRNRRLRRQGGLLVPQLRVTSASGGHSN